MGGPDRGGSDPSPGRAQVGEVVPVPRLADALPRGVVLVLTISAFVALRAAGLLGTVALPALIPLLVAGGVVSELMFQRARARDGFGPGIVVPLAMVGVVIYAIGWGPALAIGFLFPVGEALRLPRPPPLAAVTGAIGASMLGGELAVQFGAVHSYVPVPYDHALAGLVGLGLAFVLHIVVRTSQERRESDLALAQREASFRLLFAGNPHPMWVYDEDDLRVLAVNDAAVASYGYGRDQWLSMRISDIRPPEDVEALWVDVRRPRRDYQSSGMWRHRRADGSVIEVEVSSHRTPYLGRSGVLVTAIDVTERNQLEQTLRFRASHDELTGLFNRAHLREELRSQALGARGAGRGVGLLLLDLDGFFELNRTLGSEVGDALLCRVAHELGALAPAATVARVGSDEFAVLNVADHDDLEPFSLHLGRTLLARLQEPMAFGGLTVGVEASVGVAVGPSPYQDDDALLGIAQEALVEAKSSLERIRIRDARTEPTPAEPFAVIGELRHAIDHGDLRLHYQPKLDLRRGAVTGVEALVRWQHPQHGLLAPDAFVPLAERTGLIRALTAFVLREAVAQLARWRDGGLDLSVSVNLSASNLSDGDMPDMVHALLAHHGCSPQKLILEITEGSVMTDVDRIDPVVARLYTAGVRLSVDDFGTANSSLARLQGLPISEIKLDKAFVSAMDQRWSDATIVRSSINLGHDLGMRVVAEGVESDTVAQELRRMGCDEAQGYWLSRPLGPPQATAWLHDHVPADRGVDPDRRPTPSGPLTAAS